MTRKTTEDRKTAKTRKDGETNFPLSFSAKDTQAAWDMIDEFLARKAAEAAKVEG